MKKQANIIKENFKSGKYNKHLKYTCLFFVWLVSILSFIRVPYFGQFFDSVFLSFFLGYAKYIVYIYVFIYLTYKTFNIQKLKIFATKRAGVLVLAFAFFFSIMLTAINNLIHLDVKYYDQLLVYINYWTQNMWSNSKWIFGKLNYIDGGFIGEIANSLSSFFVLIFALSGILGVYFLIFKNQWTIIKQKMSEKKKVKTNYSFEKEIAITSKKSEKATTLYNYLESNSDTELNTIDIKQNIRSFLDENNIEASHLSDVDSNDSYSVSVNMSEDQYNRLKSIVDSFNLRLNAYKYSISYLNNELNIIFYKKIFNENEFQYFNDSHLKANDFIIGDTLKNQPIILNRYSNSTIHIFSKDYQNVANLLNYLMINFVWYEHVDKYEISVLNLSTRQYDIFNQLSCIKQNLTSVGDISSFLTNELKNVYRIIAELTKKDIHSVDEYNSSKINKFTKKIIVISGIGNLLSRDPEILETINKLIKNAKKTGLFLVIIDDSFDCESIAKIESEFIITFKQPKEESLKLLADISAANLKDNSGIILNTKKAVKLPFYTRLLNDEQIHILTTLINKYYNKYNS